MANENKAKDALIAYYQKELSEKCGAFRREYEAFWKWLQSTDFFDAPASTRFHGTNAGDLARHSINVEKRLDVLCCQTGSESYQVDSTVITAFSHDLCKIGCYHGDAASGYTFHDDFPAGHGEKSVMLALENGLKLTRAEMLAIRWHMGGFRDKPKDVKNAWIQDRAACDMSLATNLHIADMLATYIDEDEDMAAKFKPPELDIIDSYRWGMDQMPEVPDNDEAHFWALAKTFCKPEVAMIMMKYLRNHKNSDFFTAPASAYLYDAAEGGLCRHAMRMFYALHWLNTYTGANLPMESVAKVALFGSIGGVKQFRKEEKRYKEGGEWKSKEIYKEDDALLWGNFGAKSAYQLKALLRDDLSRDEALAVRWHMGAMDDNNANAVNDFTGAYHQSPLALLTHLAYLIAAFGTMDVYKVRGLTLV